MSPRYAIYYAPAAGSELHRLGSVWLQRDAESGAALPGVSVHRLNQDIVGALTASARRYGFHATLKAPFHLASDVSEADLRDALAAFSAQRPPVTAAPLGVRSGGAFVYLGFAAPDSGVDALAADCVRRFDRFRAPPSGGELAKRRAAGLTPAQEAHLIRWGYPYVLDQFLFHMTLCETPRDAAEAETLRDALSAHFAPVLGAPLVLDQIALFVEPEPNAAFRIAARCPFGA